MFQNLFNFEVNAGNMLFFIPLINCFTYGIKAFGSHLFKPDTKNISNDLKAKKNEDADSLLSMYFDD